MLAATTGRIDGEVTPEKVDPEPAEAILSDGTRVQFRPIQPNDKEALQRGLRQLSPESRYRRFFAPIDHLSDAQLEYFTEVDQVDHVAWVAALPDRPGHPLAGVARYIRLEKDPDAAEAAVTVVDAEQGKGLGRALLRVLTEVAIKNGVKRFTLAVLSENVKMMALMHEAGAISDGVQGGVDQMHVDLPGSVEDADTTAAPRVLRVAASGLLQGEASPGGPGTRFFVGKRK
jgi:RimJ/RimL family protein N-acetyltransferase